MHLPHPPKGDQPETWNVSIRAFNVEFHNVLFEGYSKEQIHEWIKREMIDTAVVTAIERIGLAAKDPVSEKRSHSEILESLIREKLEFYDQQIENLERVIRESEMQARLFDDQTQYNNERERDIERYKELKGELEMLLEKEISVHSED